MEKERKLKILCLYGMNNTREVFEFMTSGIRERYASLADFVIVEAPHLIDPEVVPVE